jgi:hypothetical protein
MWPDAMGHFIKIGTMMERYFGYEKLLLETRMTYLTPGLFCVALALATNRTLQPSVWASAGKRYIVASQHHTVCLGLQ